MGKIVVKYEKQVVPKDYLELAIQSVSGGPAIFSLAVADKDEAGNLKVTVLREQTMTSLEEIMDLQETYKDEPLVMFLGEKPVGQLEDIQPFDLLTDHDDRLVAVCFVTGEFNTFAKKGTTHTAEFFANTEGVRPALLEIYDACGGNLEDFGHELKSKLLEKKMNKLGSSGAIVVLTANADIQGFVSDTLATAKEFEWGFVSDTVGFGAAEAVVEKAIEPAPTLSLKDKLKAATGSLIPKIEKKNKAGETPVRGTLATDHGTAVKGVGDAEVLKNPPGILPLRAGEEYVMTAPPADCETNRQLKTWYQQTAGYCPEVKTSLRKERPEVPVRQLKNKAAMSNSTAASQVKDTTAHNIPSIPPKDPVRETPDEPLPVKPGDTHVDPTSPDLPENEKTALIRGFLKMPTVLKILDTADEEIVPPSMAKDADVPGKSINEQIGLDGGLERWKNMTQMVLMNFAGMSRKGLVRLFMEHRYQYWKLTAAYKELAEKYNAINKDKKVETTIPLPKAAPTSAKPATSAAPASTPSKSISAGSSIPRMERRRA